MNKDSKGERVKQMLLWYSSYYARIFTTRVFDAVVRLNLFPESGRIVSELNRKEIREIIFGNYRIIYRLRDDSVEILTVSHSAILFDVDKIKDLL